MSRRPTKNTRIHQLTEDLEVATRALCYAEVRKQKEHATMKDCEVEVKRIRKELLTLLNPAPQMTEAMRKLEEDKIPA